MSDDWWLPDEPAGDEGGWPDPLDPDVGVVDLTGDQDLVDFLADGPAPAPYGELRPEEALDPAGPGDPLTDLVYGSAQGFSQLAEDLWHELRPDIPVPTHPDGTPLEPDLVLEELKGHTDDPAITSVLEAGIEQWRRSS